MPARLLVLNVALATALALGACGGQPQATPAPTSTPAAALRLSVAASEVLVGPNRLLLALTDAQGVPVTGAAPRLEFKPAGGGTGTPVDTVGVYLGDERGAAKALYSARVSFDTEGRWMVKASVSGAPAAEASFNVMTTGFAPAIGQSVPPSQSLTTRDAPIEHLTSQRPVGDADFYRLSVADAVEAGKPFMVVVATPAFCQTQTCGPQLEAAQALKPRFADRMNFIHIEVFKRPDLLLKGEARPEVSPVLQEWKLQTEPWVFLVDAQGRVFERFEGYASQSELEQAVQRLLAI